MTQARWIFIILCFLLPAATDLLFHNVSVCWLIGCTVIAMIWNFFCGCEILDLVFCLFPGMIVWLLARFSKGIGMGDVLCIFLLGAGCGVEIRAGNFICRQYSLSVCTVDAKSFYNTCLPKRNTICSLAACLNLHQLSDIYCVYKQVVKPDCEC